jgi:hypothetical protein
VAEVFAGFVAGYALALLTTPLMALSLLRLRTGDNLLARLWPPDASMAAVSMIIHGLLTFTLTGIGIILGLILLAMKDGGGAAGSLNGPYTLFVAAMTLAVFAPVVALLVPLRRQVILYALLVLLVFGWLMPYLAEWSTFES